MRAAAVRLRDEVSRRIVGQRDVLDEILRGETRFIEVVPGALTLEYGQPGTIEPGWARISPSHTVHDSGRAVGLGTDC